MPQKSNNHAKFAFFYLISLISLIFTVTGAGNIIFQLINKYITDILRDFGYSSEALKFAISSLIIAAPIYYLSAWQINKNLISGELDKDSGIRRWLTYLILFISSTVIIGWLIAFVYSLLDGELSLKFSLKTLTVLILAGLTAGYYIYDIKQEKIIAKNKFIKNYFILTLASIIIILISGIFFVESPLETRQRKIDNLILEKFSKINGELNNFYVNNNRLPKDLEELKNDTTYLLAEDLETPNKEKIEYQILEKNKYSLCADFNLSNIAVQNNDYDYLKQEWPHESGRQCLSKKVSSTNKEGMIVPVR